MNEEVFDATICKFLKKAGVTSQREIEMAVRAAIVAEPTGDAVVPELRGPERVSK
jgi:hypothetical protein